MNHTLQDLRFYKRVGSEFVFRSDIPECLLRQFAEEQKKKPMPVKTGADKKSTTTTATATAAQPSVASVKPATTAAAIPSSVAKQELIRSENFIGEKGFVPELALQRALNAFVTSRIKKEPIHGVTIKCRYVVHVSTFLQQLHPDSKSSDFDQCLDSKKECVLMCVLNLTLGSIDECEEAKDKHGYPVLDLFGVPKRVPRQSGNHYVALIIDSRRPSRTRSVFGGGMIYYWDSKGIPLVNVKLREALQIRFPTFDIHDEVCHTQHDSETCAIWDILYCRQYWEYIRASELQHVPYSMMLFANSKFYDFSKDGKTQSNINRNSEFIAGARRFCHKQTARVLPDEDVPVE